VPIDVETEITIARPRHEVAAYANIESAEWRTPRPLAVGSRFAFAARFMGRRLSYVYEVREPLAAAAARRANRKDLARLKEILERRA
jgi:hypothetical protein